MVETLLEYLAAGAEYVHGFHRPNVLYAPGQRADLLKHASRYVVEALS